MIHTINFNSEALKTSAILKVVLPNDQQIKKLMILLHGNMNPELSVELLDKFSLELDLEALCDKYHMAVVIPLMKNRYYISTDDYNCDEYISYELPDYIKKKYNISDSAESILAGVSMGGFGAVLIAARTGAFQKIVSISGAYIAKDVEIGNPEVWGNLTPYSGNLSDTFLYYFLPLKDLPDSTERDAVAALELFNRRRDKPVIVVTCGTKDWLYPRNMEFVKELERREIEHQFYSIDKGEHESDCFQKGLWKAIDYLCYCFVWAAEI